MAFQIAMRFVRAVAPVVVVALALLHAAPAHADNVASLIDQLKHDDSDKVRLSAALNLAKLGDAKAILPLAGAVLEANESDKNVRAACAVGLATLVTGSTKPAIKNLVIANLKSAAANDSSDFVKQQAGKALSTITGGSSSSGTTSSGTTTSGGGKGIFVKVGPMSSKTGANDKKLQGLMVTTTTKTLRKVATHMDLGESMPTGFSGFYVDGTLNTLSVKVSGQNSTITCKVSMLLADFPNKSVFGFLNGGASVSASASASDQEMAGQDCVTAVVEDLITKKIVPTICTKASCP